LDSTERQKPSLSAEELKTLNDACKEFHHEPAQ
jgi:hypothetical protein